ncbi:MAG: PilN domain-containing protein [Gammaproteobacteria bacterium]
MTPFSADKVYYDAKIVDRQPDNRILRARLAVVPRTTLTAILTQLQTLGLTPAAVVIEGDTSGLNLLPPGKRRRRLNAVQWWGRALLLLIALTLLVAAALPLWQQRSIVVRLLPLVDAAEQEAQSVLAFRDRLDNAVESSQFLLEKRRQSALMVDVLNELTALLPDNTYLEQLSVRNGQLELRGQSAEATALISLIEDSKLFAQTTFRSPVVKDNRTGQDRFVISATVTPVPEHAPSAQQGISTEDLPEDLSGESPEELSEEQSGAEPPAEPVPMTELAPSPESDILLQDPERDNVN